MDYQQTQSSSKSVWYIVAIVVIIAALAAWYFYGTQPPTTDIQSSAIEQMQTPAISSGNTTDDIQADLNQMSIDSSALDQDEAASAQAVQSL